MPELTIYGIPNCDTVKKAMAWLDRNKVVYRFHDFRKEGISKSKLEEWCGLVGWETLLNKRSTTWRELGPVVQAKAVNVRTAVKVMHDNITLVKRPVIETETGVLVGFNEQEYQQKIKQKK